MSGLYYKADCRHFTGEKPCAPHKAKGVVCKDCPQYDPVSERVLIIKLDAAGDVQFYDKDRKSTRLNSSH